MPERRFRRKSAAEPLRPVTTGVVRILLLAICASLAAGYGIYLYYTHAFRVTTRPAPSASLLEAPELLPPEAGPD